MEDLATPEDDARSQVLDLIENYAPELVPSVGFGQRAVVHIGFIALAGAIASFSATAAVGTPVFFGCVLVGVLLGEFVVLRWHRRQLLAFASDLWRWPWKHHAKIASGFRRYLRQQRDHVVGAESSWARAYEPLERAKVDAATSVAYWAERKRESPGDAIVAGQLEQARALVAKFAQAVSELEGRREALLAFLDRCEAKVSLIERRGSDAHESRKLADLSERADSLVGDASDAIAAVGEAFLRDAASFGRALSDFRELQTFRMAEEVDIDDLERLADSVIDAAEDDRAHLDRFSQQLERSAYSRDDLAL